MPVIWAMKPGVGETNRSTDTHSPGLISFLIAHPVCMHKQQKEDGEINPGKPTVKQ